MGCVPRGINNMPSTDQLIADSFGYAIAQLLLQISGDVLQVEEGSLYPALQRLELDGWIEGYWGMSANNRRARFYTQTPDGRKRLSAETERDKEMAGAIARVI